MQITEPDRTFSSNQAYHTVFLGNKYFKQVKDRNFLPEKFLESALRTYGIRKETPQVPQELKIKN